MYPPRAVLNFHIFTFGVADITGRCTFRTNDFIHPWQPPNDIMDNFMIPEPEGSKIISYIIYLRCPVRANATDIQVETMKIRKYDDEKSK